MHVPSLLEFGENAKISTHDKWHPLTSEKFHCNENDVSALLVAVVVYAFGVYNWCV